MHEYLSTYRLRAVPRLRPCRRSLRHLHCSRTLDGGRRPRSYAGGKVVEIPTSRGCVRHQLPGCGWLPRTLDHGRSWQLPGCDVRLLVVVVPAARYDIHHKEPRCRRSFWPTPTAQWVAQQRRWPSESSSPGTPHTHKPGNLLLLPAESLNDKVLLTGATGFQLNPKLCYVLHLLEAQICDLLIDPLCLRLLLSKHPLQQGNSLQLGRWSAGCRLGTCCSMAANLPGGVCCSKRRHSRNHACHRGCPVTEERRLGLS
mmetsp:Transcript_97888/g.176686  ORF Transcript_97888/g.176686 Transcript_97888/m.176686 type:complete len:257 (-) Transcript_97888:172-942(-)